MHVHLPYCCVRMPQYGSPFWHGLYRQNYPFTTSPQCAIIIAPGDVAQLGERDNRTVEVRGSSPLVSTCKGDRKGRPYYVIAISNALQIANTYGIVKGQLQHLR